MDILNRSVAFRPKLLVIGGILIGISLLVLWFILPDRHLIYTINTEQRLTEVVFNSNGQLLATAAYNGDISLWNAADGTARGRLSGHKGQSALAFSPDGTLLVSASLDGTIRLWDVAQQTLHATLWTYPPPSGGALFDFSADGSSQQTQERFTSAVFSLDGQRIFVGGGGRIIVFDAAGAFQRFVYVEDPRRESIHTIIEYMAVNRRGDVLLTKDGNGVMLWHLPSLQLRYAFVPNDPSGLWYGPQWAVFDNTGLHITTFYDVHWQRISTVHDILTVDGRLLVPSDPDSTVDGTHFRWGAGPTSFAVSPDAHTAAWGGGIGASDYYNLFKWFNDPRIAVWRLDAPHPTFYYGHREDVTNLAFSPDGQRLASVSRDTTLRVWRVGE